VSLSGFSSTVDTGSSNTRGFKVFLFDEIFGVAETGSSVWIGRFNSFEDFLFDEGLGVAETE
jgi:hypothetical protein